MIRTFYPRSFIYLIWRRQTKEKDDEGWSKEENNLRAVPTPLAIGEWLRIQLAHFILFLFPKVEAHLTRILIKFWSFASQRNFICRHQSSSIPSISSLIETRFKLIWWASWWFTSVKIRGTCAETVDFFRLHLWKEAGKGRWLGTTAHPPPNSVTKGHKKSIYIYYKLF